MFAGVGKFFAALAVIGFLLSPHSVFAAEPVRQKAIVSGTPTANLRTGAGVEHGLKLTLKEGDPVTIEKSEGEWFLVVTADGQQGYIHRNLLKPVENVVTQPPPATPVPPQKRDDLPATPTAQGSGAAQTVPPPAAKPATPPPAPEPAVPLGATPTAGQSPSLLEILEAHEAEVKIGLLVAGVAFVLGWFCGGFYYVRREHKHRRRLRL